MNSVQLRSPSEIPLYVFSVLVNLIIIALILVVALLLGYLNALAGEPLSGPTVEAIRVAFVALLFLVPGLVVYRQITRAGTRGSAVRLSPRQFPDIYAVKDDFARKLNLRRDPEIYVMSGNGALNAFAASTFGYDFVVIHSELFSNTYEKNKDAWFSSAGTSWAPAAGHEALVSAFDCLRRSGSPARGVPLASQGVLLRPTWRIPGAAGRRGTGAALRRTIRLQGSGYRGAHGAGAAVPGFLAGCCPASPIASFHGTSPKGLVRRRVFRSICAEGGDRRRRDHRNLARSLLSDHVQPEIASLRRWSVPPIVRDQLTARTVRDRYRAADHSDQDASGCHHLSTTASLGSRTASPR